MSIRRPLLIASSLLASLILADARLAVATEPAATEPTTIDLAPPAFRLPPGVRPTASEVEIDLDPSAETFTGRVAIDLAVERPLGVLWLHGTELDVHAVRIVTAEGESEPRVIRGGAQFLGFVPRTALAPGRARIEIRYRGRISQLDSSGIFAQRARGDWYAFTHFQPMHARRAFPCFDEPGFKIPWRLTLRVPRALPALSNTPVGTETLDGEHKVVRFEPTPPLPSYLVAFAVGPFELVDAGRARSGAPIRVATPRGQAGQAALPAAAAAPILARVEDYFGTPYPYAKLDLVAIPRTFQFGAMENPGLITFNQSRLLRPPGEASLDYQRLLVRTLAHELAHQWFGNLVTQAWWDDLWLTESTARWMETPVLAAWNPAWRPLETAVREDREAMRLDALDSARRVREPVTRSDDLASAFDNITYGKGAAVLRMFESWLGPEVFQDGIRRYVAAYANSSASYDRFLAAMSAAAGCDLSGPLGSFLEQPGVPLVSMELTCAAGEPPALRLAQRRFLPIGSNGDATRSWQVPVCVRWGAGEAQGRQCMLLTARTALLPLDAPRCPDLVVPTAGGVGYYHGEPRGALLETLLAAPHRLTAAERVAFTGDVDALVAAGGIDAGRMLALAALVAGDEERSVREWAQRSMAAVDPLVADAQRAAYQRLVRKVLGEQARAIGFAVRKGESEEVTLLRPQLLWVVGYNGGDETVLSAASERTIRWLGDRGALDPDLVDIALALAASRADAALRARLLDAARRADIQERRRLLEALAEVRDPALVEANLALLRSEEFPVVDAIPLLIGASYQPAMRMRAWAFMTENYDWLATRLPRERIADLMQVGERFCSADMQRALEEFFRDRATQLPGGTLALAQASERMRLCIAYRAVHAPSVARLLNGY